MAITKIHAVKSTVHKAVAYICNPEKTDGSILISSYGCSPETAAYDFRFALSKTSQSDPNKAFHLIQSFKPGEVSFKEAHQIGVELADKLLEGRYSYIVTTHIEKKHVHNHIIFCAADNIDHGKYHDCKRSYHHIRRLNDGLCNEHNLSVIQPSGKRGKSYAEWAADRENASWKTILKNNIDEAIREAETYEDFCDLIRARGYELKGETFGENAHKYISFRPLDRERFVRGSVKSLGAEYTKERIRDRIEEKALSKSKKRVAFPQRPKPAVKDYSKKTLIDTTADKFVDSPGLKHWADIQNLKIAAASYSAADSISGLEQQIADKSALAKSARTSLVETERRLKELGEVLKYAEQYKENHPYHVRYQKSKDRDAYFRRHEMELILHDGAENMLRRFGINPADLDIEKIRSDYNALSAKKETLKQTYRSAEKEADALRRKLDNLNQYLDRSPEQRTADKRHDKSPNSL